MGPHGEIRLHFLDSDRHGLDKGVPLLIVPGTAEAAEDYRDLLDMLLPRRAIVLSLRGRGSSASPQSGYGFWEVVSDVQAVIEALDLRRFALYAFSSGVPLAIGAASRLVSRRAGGGPDRGRLPGPGQGLSSAWWRSSWPPPAGACPSPRS